MGAVGRALIAFGVLVLLFVAFELWGTGLHEAQAQRQLKHDLAPVLDAARHAGTSPTTVPVRPVPGDAVALLQIPTIGLEKAVVEGVGVPDLKKGPGHYPKTPMPGQPGNVAIAGHRTTYGGPFWSLDELRPGDRIYVTTRDGRFVYRVDGSEVVKPSQTEVLDPTFGATLTLTTCTPRFSARQRLVVKATLDGTPVVAPPTTEAPTTATPKDADPLASEGLSAAHPSVWPTIWWGALAAAVALCAWLLARRFRWWLYLLGAPLFLVVLFVFFEHLADVLPAGL